ncbi:MAG: AMP-binding protein [Pseudomonadota bacterium]
MTLPTSLGAMLQVRAAVCGHGIAVVDSAGRAWNYQQLEDASGAFAQQLEAQGFSGGERLAILLDKCFEYCAALFAVARLGGIAVPINATQKSRQIRHILENSGSRWLLSTDARFRRLQADMAIDPSVTKLIIDAADCGNDVSADFSSRPKTPAAAEVLGSDSALLLYTSGSTGLPKGVELSHRNLVLGAAAVAEYLTLDESDRVLAVLPFSFDYGLNQLLSSVLVGARCVLHNYLLPADVASAVERQAITGLAGVPGLWGQIAASNPKAEAFRSLRYFTNSGGALPTGLITKLRALMPQAKPFLMYGLTEAFRSTYLPPDQIERRPNSIGKAIPHAEVHLLDEEGGAVPDGAVGEIVHCGELVAKGYWDDPIASAERFRELQDVNPSFEEQTAVFTGDYARRDEEGFLYFVGRRDSMLKRLGHRISPDEIEEVIYADERVSAAAAIGLDAGVDGHEIIVLVALRSGCECTVEELQARCRRELSSYMVPHAVHFVDSLPVNANGKIDRHEAERRWRIRNDER